MLSFLRSQHVYKDKVAVCGVKLLLIEARPRVHCVDVNDINAYHEMMSEVRVRICMHK